MSSVLYDAPGPRTRRNTLIGTIVAGILLLGVIALLLVQLGRNGQLGGEKWGPFFNPANQFFVATWRALGTGLVSTLVAAALTLVFALVIGTLLAMARITSSRAYRWLVVGVIELFRGLPVVITIFFASRVLPEVGITLPPLWYLVIGLTAYNCVIIAEIVRAGVNALPRGQSEAAYAVGLTRSQVLRLILLPQAFRIMLPALISQLVVVLKDTSLGFIIGYEEVLRVSTFAIAELRNPIQIYIVVGALYIAVNYVLSKLAVYTQRRLARGRRTAQVVGEAAPPAAIGPEVGTDVDTAALRK
jgi:glutamate transport system permease protein